MSVSVILALTAAFNSGPEADLCGRTAYSNNVRDPAIGSGAKICRGRS